MEKFKINKKILILLVSLVISCVFFLTFSSSLQDWREFLYRTEQSENQSQSQMKVEIIRDGVVLDPSLSSTLTNERNLSDIVDTPPTKNVTV